MGFKFPDDIIENGLLSIVIFVIANAEGWQDEILK